jgi:thiamine pyrophosphate-dependent acetolactate synthase large subunit-like protein
VGLKDAQLGPLRKPRKRGFSVCSRRKQRAKGAVVSAICQQSQTAVRARYGTRILLFVMNDRGLGAELQKLRALKREPAWAMIPSPDFAQIAEAFGLVGRTLRDVDQTEQLVRKFTADTRTHVVDVQVASEVVSRYFRSAL